MMLKFTKLSENASKIVYSIMNGIFGTAEYDRAAGTVRFFDNGGEEFSEAAYQIAFAYVVENNFPGEYLYAAG